MSTTKKQTIVYIDAGAITSLCPEPFGPITPESLNPIIKDLAEGREALKYIFVDPFATGHSDEHVSFNDALTLWSQGGYSNETCPRAGSTNKESIDFVLINRVQRDVRLLSGVFDLHIVLVVGDVDYRPLIIQLLEQNIRVSLIAPKASAILNDDILDRLYRSFSLFEIKTDSERTFKSSDRMIDSTLHGGTANIQGAYAPSPDQLERTLTILNASRTICPYCNESMPTGYLSSHYCHGVVPKNPPPGITTLSHVEHVAIEWSGRSTESLLGEIITQQHRSILPEVLDAIIDRIPVIPWPIADTLLLAQRIHLAPPIGLAKQGVSEEALRILTRHGIASIAGDQILVGHAYTYIDRLIEEVSQRTSFPLTARLFSPEGAIKEAELRARLISTLQERLTLSPIQEDEPREFWESDTALVWLTNPDLDIELRGQVLSEVDDVHTLRYWASLIKSIPDEASTDMRSTTEQIAESLRHTTLLTPNSIRILVTNGVLTLKPESEALYLNKQHPLLSVIPFVRAVA